MKIISCSGPCNIGDNPKTKLSGGSGFSFLLSSLAQSILFSIFGFGKRTGSDPKVLTLIQGFDCGNKQDYLELCLILSQIFLY